jgi:hypothetical protein
MRPKSMMETSMDALGALLLTVLYLPLLITGLDSLIPEDSYLARRLKRRL